MLGNYLLVLIAFLDSYHKSLFRNLTPFLILGIGVNDSMDVSKTAFSVHTFLIMPAEFYLSSRSLGNR